MFALLNAFACRDTSFTQRGKQDRNEKPDDCDDHQKLDE